LFMRPDGGDRRHGTSNTDARIRDLHGASRESRRHDHRRLPGTASRAISRVGGRGGGLLRTSTGATRGHRGGRCLRLVLWRLRRARSALPPSLRSLARCEKAKHHVNKLASMAVAILVALAALAAMAAFAGCKDDASVAGAPIVLTYWPAANPIEVALAVQMAD